MSRIGNIPIPFPGNVQVTVAGGDVSVEGPMGSLHRTFGDRVKVEVDGDRCVVTRRDEERQSRAYHGLTRALINNMVTGVSQGYRKTLKIVGVGYRVLARGRGLELQVGFSHHVPIPAVDGIEFEVPNTTTLVIKGIDKELVGQVAAEIRRVRPPEPYKGKGIRYEDEYVRRKSGKAGVVGR